MNKPIYFLLIISFFIAGSHAYAVPEKPGIKKNIVAPAPLFKVADVLQSNMVIQQASPFRIWGTAAPGTRLKINASWTERTVSVKTDKQGRWFDKITVPKAVPGEFKTQWLTIVQGNDTVKLENLLIGEVWICSGQSNMTFMLDSIPGWGPGVPDFKQEVAAANYPFIRLIKIGTALEAEPQSTSTGEWKACTPKTVGGFSAVGYFFGRKLFDSLQVPVGLISNGIPAAGCQSFTDRTIMEADPQLKRKYIAPFEDKPRTEKEHIITTLLRPSLIYNGMIHPIRHLSVRGFIWYQGESNREDGELYTRLCSAMLKGWRKDFNQGNLPFYFVQMPSYIIKGEDSTSSSYARFREHQKAMLKVRNTGMAVIMDVGDPYDIHPRNKKPVGERLAGLALHNTYHYNNIVYKGPEYSSYKIDGENVIISFDPATLGSGLSTNNGLPPEHFYVAGEDSIFHKAVATIVNGQVWVHADEVVKPVAVRYAFTNAPLTNFSNKNGLPAAPFRTDKWNK